MIEILRLSLPLTAWIAGFSAIYGLQGLTCSRHWPAGVEARPLLIAAWAIAILLQGLILLAILRAPSTSRLVQGVATALAVTALIAAVWTMMPVLAGSGCL
jgi:hypothetical protein